MKKIISHLLTLQTKALETTAEGSSDTRVLREQIPAHILERFDKFLLRGKKGVALVQNGVCKGCQIQVPLNVIHSLITGSNALSCGNCGRYLYLSDEEAVAFRDRNTAVIVAPKPKVPKLTVKTAKPRSKKAQKAELEVAG